MIALPVELEQQVIQFAQFEHTDPVSFLKRLLDSYTVNRANRAEETMYLKGIESSLSEEWNGADDEVNFRDL